MAYWLFDEAMGRAREMGRERGHAEITVDSCIYRDDEPLRALLSDHDFTLGTTYHRMRVDHTEGAAVPDVAAGFVVRRDAFAIDVLAGRTGTMLYVDTNNPTPALGHCTAVRARSTG